MNVEPYDKITGTIFVETYHSFNGVITGIGIKFEGGNVYGITQDLIDNRNEVFLQKVDACTISICGILFSLDEYFEEHRLWLMHRVQWDDETQRYR